MKIWISVFGQKRMALDLLPGDNEISIELTALNQGQKELIVHLYPDENTKKELCELLLPLDWAKQAVPYCLLTLRFDDNKLLITLLQEDARSVSQAVDMSIRKKATEQFHVPSLPVVLVSLFILAAVVFAGIRFIGAYLNRVPQGPVDLSSSEKIKPKEAESTVVVDQEITENTPVATEKVQENNTVSRSTVIAKEYLFYFDPESAELTFENSRLLTEIVSKFPDIVKVIAEGHCALYGNEAERISLAYSRAENIAGFLVNAGWPSDKIIVESMGGQKPVSVDPLQQNLNRRVKLLIEYSE